MDRADAYAVLCKRLETLRAHGFDQLQRRAGQNPTAEIVRVHGEDLTVEVQISFIDKRNESLKITAAAYGPSTWTLQRLEESIVIRR